MTIQLSDHFTYKKLLRFCLSPICMMIFISVYGVVDGFFVSNFVGKNAFAALNLVMPPIMILCGMCYMIGSGGTALVSKTMGEQKPELANQYFSMMVKVTALAGTLLSVLCILLLRPIVLALGATPELMEDCLIYGGISFAFMPPYMLQSIFQNFLITAERPRLGLIATVAAGLTNMVLDALFVAVLDWGIAGAAFATGLSQCVGCVLPLIYFLRPNTSRLRIVRCRMQAKPILRACYNGMSELMTYISGSLVSILYNYQLLHFAGANGVAAYGVLMYVQFIFTSLFFGYAIGAAPIIGYHYGAQNHGELKNLLKKSVTLMFSTGAVLTAASFLLADPLVGMFVGYDADLFEMTRHGLLLFTTSFILAGFNIFTSSFFTALNNGTVSAVISVLRTLVFQMLCVLILPLLFGLDGIWWALIVAEIFAALLSLTFLLAKRRQYHYL